MMFRLLFLCFIFSIVKGLSNLVEYSEWKKPWFCHQQECRPYVIVNKTEKYETRCYSQSEWWMAKDHKLTVPCDFTPLYKVIRQYIDGYNVKKMKYNLTVPVLLRVGFQKNLVNLHSHMWIPPHVFPFLSKPLNPKLHFVHQHNYCVYVRSFGGHIHSYDDELKKQVDILKSDLDKAGLAYPQDFFWFAGYDAPWTVHGRHNEVWLRVVKKKKFNY